MADAQSESEFVDPPCAKAPMRLDERVYRLWDELGEYGSHAPDDALAHCLRTVSEWIGADTACWMGAERLPARGDSGLGWRMRCMSFSPHCSCFCARSAAVDGALREAGDALRRVMADAGRFRVYSLHTGVVDFGAFTQTAHYDHFYRRAGVYDRIWAVSPVSADAESCFVFDSRDPNRCFSESDKERVAGALRGITWFHRQQLLSHGMGTSEAPLSPAERRVLIRLLSGASEQAIADEMHLSFGTVHQYVVSLYRKLGVRSRTEFMALWLRGRR